MQRRTRTEAPYSEEDPKNVLPGQVLVAKITTFLGQHPYYERRALYTDHEL
jgi:hypothetical protein